MGARNAFLPDATLPGLPRAARPCGRFADKPCLALRGAAAGSFASRGIRPDKVWQDKPGLQTMWTRGEMPVINAKNVFMLGRFSV